MSHFIDKATFKPTELLKTFKLTANEADVGIQQGASQNEWWAGSKFLLLGWIINIIQNIHP